MTDTQLEELALSVSGSVTEWLQEFTEYDYAVGDNANITRLILATLKSVAQAAREERIVLLEATLRDVLDALRNPMGAALAACLNRAWDALGTDAPQTAGIDAQGSKAAIPPQARSEAVSDEMSSEAQALYRKVMTEREAELMSRIKQRDKLIRGLRDEIHVWEESDAAGPILAAAMAEESDEQPIPKPKEATSGSPLSSEEENALRRKYARFRAVAICARELLVNEAAACKSKAIKARLLDAAKVIDADLKADTSQPVPLSSEERREILAMLEPLATAFAARTMDGGNTLHVAVTFADIRAASELHAHLSAAPPTAPADREERR